jgi:hypothetical protein
MPQARVVEAVKTEGLTCRAVVVAVEEAQDSSGNGRHAAQGCRV